jgi:hypothetical protein
MKGFIKFGGRGEIIKSTDLWPVSASFKRIIDIQISYLSGVRSSKS